MLFFLHGFSFFSSFPQVTTHYFPSFLFIVACLGGTGFASLFLPTLLRPYGFSPEEREHTRTSTIETHLNIVIFHTFFFSFLHTHHHTPEDMSQTTRHKTYHFPCCCFHHYLFLLSLHPPTSIYYILVIFFFIFILCQPHHH